MEVNRANSSLKVVRGTRECRKVTKGRSYAEVVGPKKNQAFDCYPCSESLARVPNWLKDAVIVLEAQTSGSDDGTLNSMNKKFSARSMVRPKVESKKEKQASEVGEKNVTVVGEGKDVSASVCRSSLSASMLIPKTLPYPANFGLEALRGHMESEGDGLRPWVYI